MRYQKLMKDEIRQIHTRTYIDDMSRSGYRHDGDFGIYMNATADGFPLRVGRPYRAAEGRVAIVAAGVLDVTLDLSDYHLAQGDVFFIPPGGVAVFNSMGRGCMVDVAIFRNLPGKASLTGCFVVHGNDDAARRTMQYMSMIFDQMGRCPVHGEVIAPLFDALILDTLTLRPEAKPTPSESLLTRFVTLVSREGAEKRTVAWYAERLCVSQSHLSAVVKGRSGMTVSQWIDRALVQEAKVLLYHSDMPVAEVAERLGFATPSFFIHFFHKKTGETPLQFRKNAN